jgi:hypothetical protein
MREMSRVACEQRLVLKFGTCEPSDLNGTKSLQHKDGPGGTHCVTTIFAHSSRFLHL